jgi:N-acyl homoserine lactone hydrolase
VYEVYPLKVGDIVEPEPRIIYLGDCGKTMALGIFFFLIRGGGRNVLVDTGVSKADGDRFNPSAVQRPTEDPLEQLTRHGVSPDSIDTVIATHLHWDHISPVVLKMPNARVFVDPKEVRMVLDPPHPWFGQFVYTEVIDQLAREKRFVETADGDEIAPGIRIMSTPGHTFGGQSVVVETSRGKVVITGDVCFTYRNLEEDRPGGLNCDLVQCFRSLERIRTTADVVLPGHDLKMLEAFPEGVR